MEVPPYFTYIPIIFHGYWNGKKIIKKALTNW